jgi:signal recognition particle GTPase
MTAEVKETKYEKAQVPDEERCLFTKRDGSRCKSAHMGNASRQCILHEGRNQKADEAEAQAVAEQLLANDVELRTKDDVNRLTSQLFTMVAAKKISRQDGSLLAYIASVMLQTIAPVRKKPNVERVEEIVESVAPPLREERIMFPRHNAGVFGEQAGTLGTNHNPYLHTGKLR